MGLFDFFTRKQNADLPQLNADDDAVVAVAAGEVFDISETADAMFAEKLLGDGIAFRFDQDSVILCAPANGTLKALFPTGHAFGVETNEGVEILVHCGINTVEANGDGFKVLGKKQGDKVRAGDPIVKADLKKLREKYDVTTMLVITNPNGRNFEFIPAGKVERGDSVIK